MTTTELTLEQSLKILAKFSCTEPKPVESAQEKLDLQSALLMVTDNCDYQNFGICADSLAQAFVVLESYLEGLNYEIDVNKSEVDPLEGPVYVKFNTRKWSVYTDTYGDKYRGVLVSCQSAEHEAVNGTYGHFPLDLFQD
jgi:Domain of unknown function (DUF1824)